MTIEQKLRFIELSKKLKPDITRLDELNNLIRSSEKEKDKIKRKIDLDQSEIIALMKSYNLKTTPDDIELAKHFNSYYLRIYND